MSNNSTPWLPEHTYLSAREVDVLSLMAKGLSNNQIGTRLHLAEDTIKTHMQRVFRKLRVNGRVAAVTAAMAEGWIPCACSQTRDPKDAQVLQEAVEAREAEQRAVQAQNNRGG